MRVETHASARSAGAHHTVLQTPLVRRVAIVATVVLLFALTRIVLLEFYQPRGTDITIYHDYFARAAAGQAPYRDIAIEYPPVAWWVMAWPGTTDWAAYQQRFRRLMFVFEAGGFALFAAILIRRRREFAAWGCAAYVVATALLGPVLYDRLDAGMLFLLVLWAYAWLRGSTNASQATRWLAFAYVVLGVSVAYKMMPIVLAPLLLLCEFTTRQTLRAVVVRSGALALGMVLPFLLYYRSAGVNTSAFLQYHADRGIEINSLFANLLWMMSGAGLPVNVAYRFSAFELVSPLSSAMASISTASMAALVLILCLRGLLLGQGYDRGRAYVYGCLVLPALLPLAKVLSTQYFVWAIPLMLLLGVELVSDRRWFILFCVLLVLLAFFTTCVYPFGFGGLRTFRSDVWLILTARNALLSGLTGWTLFRVLTWSA